MSTLIKGGRIITAADDYVGDVFVDGERISMLGESLDVDADRVIDASGKYVLPGCVDPHTHLDMPFGGTTTIDDVTSGQTAAAFGGTTCHVDFCIQSPGSSFADALDTWHGKREGKQIIDMGFHIAVTDLREGGSLEELARLPEQGITSYKLFMAYKGALMVDDETLFRTMEVAADTGALVMVHAENGDAIDVLVKQALAAGNTAPHYHALTRPPELEGEATNRAIQLARIAGAPLYVVHVSCKEAVDPIARAREQGWDVWGETCTQYFFIDYTYLERPDFEGAKYVYTPPPRDRENQEVLWHAVRSDILSAVSTDHCAFLWDGQKSLGRDDFSKIPNGGPGLENRLHMIHEFGVRAGRISLNRMVELLATNPAKLFGLYPRKGTIAPGSDADIVVFDPDQPPPDHRGDAALEGRLQPLRGNRGDGIAGARAAPRERPRRVGRVARGARRGRVRRAGRVRAGAPARRRSLTTSCAEVRRTHSPLSGALRASQRSAAVRRTGDAVDLPDFPVEGDHVRGVPDDLERRRLIECRGPDRRHGAVGVHSHQRSRVGGRRRTRIAAGHEVALREGEQRPSSAHLDVHCEVEHRPRRASHSTILARTRRFCRSAAHAERDPPPPCRSCGRTPPSRSGRCLRTGSSA